MTLVRLLYALLGLAVLVHGATEKEIKARGKASENQEVLGYGIDGERYRTACPDYKHYATTPQYVSPPAFMQPSQTLMDGSADL